MKKKSVILNYFYQASYQLLLVILPVITVPIVSKALEPSGIGIYNFISSVVAYFVLASGLGLSNYGVREIAMVRENRKKRSQMFWELQFLNIITSLIAICIYLIISLLSPYPKLYLIQSMTIIGALFDISWFFGGMEDFKLITVRNFIIRLCSFGAIVILIRDKSDLVLYFVIQSLSTLIAETSLWVSISKYIDWVPIKISRILKHLKNTLSYFISKIAMNLYENLTKTILGIMTTMSVVGFYSNSLSLVVIAGSVINSMNTVMIPRMSNLFGSEDKDEMINILEITIHLQLFLTIMIAFGIIGITDKLVFWFFGEKFEMIKNIIPLLTPMLILRSLQMSIASQYSIPRNEMKGYNLSVIFGSVVLVVSSVVLIPIVGIYGGIIGITLGYLTICILRIRELVSESKFKFNNIEILKYFVSGFLMLGVIYLVTGKMSSSIFTTVLQSGIGFLSYMVISYLMGGNPLIRILKSNL